VPSLTLDALRKRLADRKPGPVHLFVGDDVQLMARMVDAVEAVVDAGDRPFAVERLHAAEPGGSPVDISAAARNMPMLGDRRIVIVLRAERLLKPKRAGKSTGDDDEEAVGSDDGAPVDASPLEDYLNEPAPFSTVVFVASAVDKTRRLTKKLIEKAFVTIFDGNENDDARGDVRANLANVLRGTLAREGRSLERSGEQMLLRRAAGDVSKLRDDIEKLVLFAGERLKLTEDDVMAVSADHNAVEDEWAVTNAIAAGNAAGALVETGRRFERGDSAHALVGQLRWWVSNTLAGADAARVKPALEALLRTDLALKSSGGDDRVLVERLVVELTGRPVSSPRWGR
jgi:DNA polymerase III delta subunit